MRVLCLLTLCLSAATAQATVWYVDASNTRGPHTGRAWYSAFVRVQDAIDAAADDGGGEVWVARGIYGEPRVSYPHGKEKGNTGSLIMREGVHLYGGFLGNETERSQRDSKVNLTVLDGSQARTGLPAYHVILGVNESTLDGFTVTGGVATDAYPRIAGGGMYCVEGMPRVTHCIFQDNHADSIGGGIYSEDCLANMENCIFTGNTAGLSGAGISVHKGEAQLRNCAFVQNAANTGAGVSCYMSVISLDECSFRDNAAPGHGGAGLKLSSSVATISACEFTRNDGHGGGAVDALMSDVTIANTLFSFNSSLNPDGLCCSTGGAIYASSTALDISHCTFKGNRADSGGVLSGYLYNAHIRNTDFLGNSADWGAGAIFAYSESLILDNCTFAGNSSGAFEGGAIKVYMSSPVINRCTFVANSAGEGGALYVLQRSVVSITQSIFHGNGPPIGLYMSGAANVSHSCIDGGWPGAGNVDGIPNFVRLPHPGGDQTWGTPDDDYGDLRLHPDSPCVDAGARCVIEPVHSADQDGAAVINLDELLRVVQIYNVGSYGCGTGTEDGFVPGGLERNCCPHDSDYGPSASWTIELNELLRLIQFYNGGGYRYCPGEETEDGFCPVPQ